MIDTITSPVRTMRHQLELGDWESIKRQPDARLAPYVTTYEGYVEHGMEFSRRMEVPGAVVPLIINFGPAYRVTGPGNVERARDYGSFIAGLNDAYVIVEATGLANCVQVNFTPSGAHLFLGMPMHELTNRTLRFEDVFGARDRQFVAQLEDTPGWEARFDLIDAFIIGRLTDARPDTAYGVEWAWRRLHETDGAIPIAALADEIGWSRKHLVVRFREQIGLPPKTVARIVRFRRVVEQIDRTDVHWARIAYDCGYYDQAHFNRDVRAFTGGTPTELLARRIPDGGLLGHWRGLAHRRVTSVQDHSEPPPYPKDRPLKPKLLFPAGKGPGGWP